jgi:hypothetical protein
MRVLGAVAGKRGEMTGGEGQGRGKGGAREGGHPCDDVFTVTSYTASLYT